jgi:putative intracellular protease/amidase
MALDIFGKNFMPQQLTGKRVAIVVTDGFEQDELEKPRQALEEAGAKTEVISPKSGKVNLCRDKKEIGSGEPREPGWRSELEYVIGHVAERDQG